MHTAKPVGIGPDRKSGLDDAEIARRLQIIDSGISQTKAARLIGISQRVLARGLAGWRARAAERNLLGMAAGPVPLEDGFIIREHAVNYGPDGSVKQEWVKTAPDRGPVFELPEGHHYTGVSAWVDAEGRIIGQWLKTGSDKDEVNLFDLVRETVAAAPVGPTKLPKRNEAMGEHLLVIDLADVHFLKLCVESETGHTYNREVARHRVVEGTKALLRMARPMGIGRILFVLGNDILHVDNPRSTTTSGTFQDSDGTIFQGFRDAASAVEEAIAECTRVADVDLVHCMSNHDWLMGWALSQAIAGRLRGNPRVRATEYNLSEAHRKYYRFGGNLFGLTHGDGAKEEKLYGLMVKEAREHVSDCQNLYWFLHHVHHKDRKTRGEFAYLREKDHNGMTAHISGSQVLEGGHLNIEYVRSPSAPDGWHDRNGYVNRQGVECFVYHPTLGQRARFTEWF